MVGDQKFFFYPTVIAPSIVEFDRRMDTGVLSDDDPATSMLAHFLLLLSLVCFVVVCRDMACYNVRSVVCRGWRYALACCDSDALLF